jgi:predicted dehydrogenase
VAFRALLIGCGKIGALYDIHLDKVMTHAKSYFKNPDFVLSIYDQDINLSKRISKIYKTDVISIIDYDSLKHFDCLSICSPTQTHAYYLKMAFEAKVPLVICEKPISNSIHDLDDLVTIYKNSSTKVIVNYMRRFQPDFIILKEEISKHCISEKLNHISIRYQRGFLNNCSHALDLLSFILDKILTITSPKIIESENDHFENDPTLSMYFNWDNTQVHILGLTNINFSIFEIELYFENNRISILDAGNKIKWMKSSVEEKKLFTNKEFELKIHENSLINYMVPIIELATKYLKQNIIEDNFLTSIELNRKLINLINKEYGKTSN